MDQTLEDSLSLAQEGLGTSQQNQVVPSHSTAKDLQLEREQAEINYPRSVPESEFTVEEESDNESLEDFEDALDEFLTQSVEECLRSSEASLSRAEEAETEPPVSPDLGQTTVEIDRQDVIQTLLDRQRNERALELRRLRFESRQEESRRSLEHHLNRRLTRNNNVNETESQSSVESPIVYRSQNVLNEISNLSSRAMVSGIQSSFRERIEQTLQQNIARQARPVLNTNTSNVNVQSVSSPIESSNVPVAPVLPQRHSNPYISSRPAPQPQPFLLERSQNNPVGDQYREQIVYEISDLVHSQLVSSTLQSAFRVRLENTVRERLRRSGQDGDQTRQNVMQALNNRVTSNIQRNDFSHLGITPSNDQTADQTENLDSASSIGSGQQNQQRRTRTVVYQNNPREIRDLKMQLQEMKDMLKLSFELQLDMQRSFKQEISALVAGTFQQEANTSARLNRSQVHSEGKCIICTEDSCDTVLIGCGHMVSCYVCSMNLKNKGHNCPVCRAPIKDILRTYKSSLDSTD